MVLLQDSNFYSIVIEEQSQTSRILLLKIHMYERALLGKLVTLLGSNPHNP